MERALKWILAVLIPLGLLSAHMSIAAEAPVATARPPIVNDDIRV